MSRETCPMCGSYACLVQSPAFCRHGGGHRRIARTSVPVITAGTEPREDDTDKPARNTRKRADRA